MKRVASILSFALLLAGCHDFTEPTAKGHSRLSDLGSANWTFAAPMLQARYRTAAVTGADGRIYVFGGQTFDFPFAAGSEVYDPAANSWSSIPSSGFTINAAIARGGDGRIYIAGSNFGADAQAYDPVTQSYTPIASMHFARYQSAGASGVDGKVYVFGGVPLGGPSFTPPPEAYDPATDTWTILASPPYSPHASPAVATGADGRIYVFGGGTGFGPSDVVEAYDPATNSWTLLAPAPEGLTQGHVAVASNDGRIYVFGVYDAVNGIGTDHVYAYEPATDTWTTATPLCVPRYDPFGAADLAGHVYAIGGIDAIGHTLRSVEVLSEAGAPGCGIAPTNGAPIVNQGGPYVILEGGAVFFNASATSDPDGDALTYDWDFGDGQSQLNAGPTPSHVYAVAGVYTGSVTVNDGHGHSPSAVINAIVNNVPPSVAAFAGETISQGETYMAGGSFSDPGADTFTGSVNYGDGTSVPLVLSGNSFTLHHTYTASGSFTVTVTITDGQGASGTASATVVVVAHTPAPSAQGLGELVQHLLSTGAISSQTAQQLMASVNAAAASIAAGNTNAARGQLGAFINKVEAGMKTGKISAGDGAALIAYGRSILG